ncbi:MAG TPA: DUF4893 domain-containing protein [Allosphingosinicella sp.]|uniref:DUF4893 domain-containing protein n=1 Tax=Allosphingosinicella sp. TaxID=2823234 RepID=UPI002EDB0F36
MPKLITILAPLGFAAAAPVLAQATDNWRSVATAADERRIAESADAWQTGLAEARRADRRGLARLGTVVNRTAALPRPQPTPGNYRCRTIKLGSKGEGTSGFIAYGWFNCRVTLSAGGDLTLTKTTGSQRPMGKLYPHNSRALVFVGTLALSSTERTWPRYGTLPDRDVVGIFERIGSNRYRLVMPQPSTESELDILELVR